MTLTVRLNPDQCKSSKQLIDCKTRLRSGFSREQMYEFASNSRLKPLLQKAVFDPAAISK